MITYMQARRLLMGGFTAGIALLLGIWSWSSLASSASLSVNPTTPRQNDTVTLVGQGFLPGEKIAVWITYPDFRVYGVAELTATDNGGFSYPYLPDFLGATFTPTGKYTYTAHGKQSEREVYTDITVSVAAAPGASAGVALRAEHGKNTQGAYVAFHGSGYQAGEEVALWVRYPDNAVVDLGRTSADPDGKVEYGLNVTGLPIGRYALTARGLASSANGIAEFDLAANDLTVATGKATLQIGPSPESQRSYASFLGVGFGPNEVVTVWVTLPNYATRWIGDVRTDSNGAFRAVLYLSEQEPVG
ncbi:MAG: hypothetical protein HGA65_20795, partial [Oscillochloris sp.]|nr:hypothetical protein [Oscillochloris sp.]